MEGKGEVEEMRHGKYKGVRKRSWGAWVSEIRIPKKKERLWLGSFPTPEVAALAHDIAELGLKGTSASLNFPKYVKGLEVPNPVSTGAARKAAFDAAFSLGWLPHQHGNEARAKGEDEVPTQAWEYVDEELLFQMPSIISYMANALLMAPPSFYSAPHLPENDFEDIRLWE